MNLFRPSSGFDPLPGFARFAAASPRPLCAAARLISISLLTCRRLLARLNSLSRNSLDYPLETFSTPRPLLSLQCLLSHLLPRHPFRLLFCHRLIQRLLSCSRLTHASALLRSHLGSYVLLAHAPLSSTSLEFHLYLADDTSVLSC